MCLTVSVAAVRVCVLIVDSSAMPRSVQLGLFSATFGCLKHPESTTYKFIVNIAGTAAPAPTSGHFVPVEVVVEVPIGTKIRVFNLILPADKSGPATGGPRGRGGYHGHRGSQMSPQRREYVYQVVAALAFKLALRDITFVEVPLLSTARVFSPFGVASC
jgi:hypothetical protein